MVFLPLQKKKKANIVVYGTLKREQTNHTKYPLVTVEEANIPFLLNIAGTGRRIIGEIYSVDEQLLHFLDDFDGCPNWYQRTPKGIEILEWKGADDLPDERPAVISIITCFVYSTTCYQSESLQSPSLS
ncbi:hypothetical protein XELAEV_18015641mg [Xenopus laevis]|uniref:Gamma-glutamylaminecyclotransferase n=1 Tax=Xenopus laevis TaxID=8355 RepID=A0A974HW58_XENLA|nr:hypothetical protein XELAEV_18015641mg [Xenopus laevis]